jgi:hypothetical protein
MGTPDVRIGHASPQLRERIARYHMQSLFSAAFNVPLRLENDPTRTNEDVAHELLDFLPHFNAELRRKGISALPLSTTAAINYYRTTNNALLLEGRIDLLIAAACLPAVRQYLLDARFTERPSEERDAQLFVRGELTCALHTTSARFYSPAGRKLYQSLETAYRQSDALHHQSIGNSQWPAFPPLFLIIYMTARIQQELFAGQPSLRSFCDWMMVLHGERTALGIAESNLEIRLRELHLHHLYRALGYIAQAQFGMERNSYACLSRFTDHEAHLGDWLWRALVERRIPKCRPGLAYRDGLTFAYKVKYWSQLSQRSAQLQSLCRREANLAPWMWLFHAQMR